MTRITPARHCPDCAAGHDHCHDTLLVHPDGTLGCAGHASCDESPERHPLVVDCRELDPPCHCVGEPAATARPG